jgi:RNA polymerase sigma-70 factor (ECF subfamily)
LALDLLLSGQRDQLRALADQALPARLKARIDASDIVQQTCLSAFRRIGEFHGSSPAQFAAWLQQIQQHNLQNAIRDQLQTQKRGDGREGALPDAVGDARADTPSQQAMRREAAEALSRALEQLPDEERQALRLRYLEGLTLVQVCERLDLTKDAAVWLLQKGLKHLRQWLPREVDDAG